MTLSIDISELQNIVAASHRAFLETGKYTVTDRQKKRDEQHEQIYKRYLEIKDLGGTKFQVYRVLSKEFGITVQAVEYIVKKRAI